MIATPGNERERGRRASRGMLKAARVSLKRKGSGLPRMFKGRFYRKDGILSGGGKRRGCRGGFVERQGS